MFLIFSLFAENQHKPGLNSHTNVSTWQDVNFQRHGPVNSVPVTWSQSLFRRCVGVVSNMSVRACKKAYVILHLRLASDIESQISSVVTTLIVPLLALQKQPRMLSKCWPTSSVNLVTPVGIAHFCDIPWILQTSRYLWLCHIHTHASVSCVSAPLGLADNLTPFTAKLLCLHGHIMMWRRTGQCTCVPVFLDQVGLCRSDYSSRKLAKKKNNKFCALMKLLNWHVKTVIERTGT